MSKWVSGGLVAVLALTALVFVIMVVVGESEVRAQSPDLSEQLNDILDELTLVRSQMSGLRDEVGLVREQTGGVRDGLAVMRNQLERLTRAVGSSTYSPAAYTQTFVEDAINRYEADGRDATIAYYNTPESVDGQWYVFIADENDVVVSLAPIPSLVGQNLNDTKTPNGYPSGASIARAATEDGVWVDYIWDNPNKGIVEQKHSWVVRHDGLIFGSGWYEPAPSKTAEPGQYTKDLVQQAVHLHQTAGRDVAIEYYNSPQSVDGEWYVFIADENDIVVSHPTVPDLVGMALMDIEGPDGYPAGLSIARAATEDGAWVDYIYQNPSKGVIEKKHSWVVRHDGMIYGSGWYEAGPSKSDQPAEYTMALVQQAIELYETAGLDATVAYYNTPESMDSGWYVFIIDQDGVLVSHPNEVGTPVEDVKGPNGYPAGLSVAMAATEDGVWVDYIWDNPDKGIVEQKHSWVVRHDGLIFGSGWYEPGPSKSDQPAEYTMALVQQAIELYETAGLDATVAYYNTPESMDSGWYVFIIDQDGVLVSHPNEVGTPVEDVKGPNGYPAGLSVAMAATEDGVWVDYIWDNPDKGIVEQKHSWVVRHDGLIFGSGWYEPGPSKSDQPAEYTMALVQQAIELYETAGLDATVAYYNTPESMDSGWYVFIIDQDGVLVSHPNEVGTPVEDVKGPNGYPAGLSVAMAATEDGAWVDYVYYNFDKGIVEVKHTWAIVHNGMIYGSGWYESGPSRSDQPAEYAMALVQQATHLYDTAGLDATVAYYNSPESVDGEWYVAIADPNDIIIVHPVMHELIGTDIEEIVGSDGYELGKEIAKATEDGHWIDYLWPNPATGSEEPKRTWAVRHDGSIFVSGYYSP